MRAAAQSGAPAAVEAADDPTRVDEGVRLGHADRAGVAAPRPLFRRSAEACLDRVHRHVPVCLHEVRIVLDPHRVVARPEDMALHAMADVELHCVPEVQGVHADRERLVGDVEHHVVVVRHHAEPQTDPACDLAGPCELANEREAIAIVAIELSRPDRMGVYMEDALALVSKPA